MEPYLVIFFASLDVSTSDHDARLVIEDGGVLEFSYTRMSAVAHPSRSNSEHHPTATSQPTNRLIPQFQLGDGTESVEKWTSEAVIFAITD